MTQQFNYLMAPDPLEQDPEQDAREQIRAEEPDQASEVWPVDESDPFERAASSEPSIIDAVPEAGGAAPEQSESNGSDPEQLT